jgi:hypothetical protein
VKVTIVPEHCGQLVDRHPNDRLKLRCGDRSIHGVVLFVCRQCQSLGALIAQALYDDFLHWAGMLAFNLCMAALLGAAARRDRNRWSE